MRIGVILLFLSALFSGLSHAQEAGEDSFEKGMVLYNQNKWVESQSPLKVAAEAGGREAQYYLAESIRLANRYMTNEAASWYVAAAEQGDIFAMLRLSKRDTLCIAKKCAKDNKFWEKKALEVAGRKASEGDSSAMYAMYFLTGDKKWLMKSAEAGNGEAGYFLVRLMLDDTWDRETGRSALTKEAKQYLEKAAFDGNPNAMELFSEFLSEEGDYQSSKKWLESCLDTSHYECILRMEMIHQGDNIRDEGLGYKPEKAIAYGLFLFRVDSLGSPKPETDLTPEFRESLTSEDKARGEAFFKEWKETHPPVSYHVRKFGF
ncbi:tetratricopeptide repeat protein [Pseudomonas sp. NCHU5208]|uniref:tetratricopeptide repeat protein n=1 Tax=unclassified Pseudomonas TaxID=196821 RepID=UPI003F9BA454